MIRKVGTGFPKRIMLKQRDEIMIRYDRTMIQDGSLCCRPMRSSSGSRAGS